MVDSREALVHQIDELQDYLLRMVRKNGPAGGPDRPSDLVQQTLADAMAHAPQFRGSTLGEMKAWTRRILQNNYLRLLRGRRRSDGRAREVPLEAVAPDASCFELDADPSTRAEVAECHQRLSHGLTALSEEARQVLLLRHREGLQFAAIAARLDSTEEAIRKVHSRTLERMRQILQSPGL